MLRAYTLLNNLHLIFLTTMFPSLLMTSSLTASRLITALLTATLLITTTLPLRCCCCYCYCYLCCFAALLLCCFAALLLCYLCCFATFAAVLLLLSSFSYNTSPAMLKSTASLPNALDLTRSRPVYLSGAIHSRVSLRVPSGLTYCNN